MFISSIERFITDRLINSEYIPDDIQIARVATTVDDSEIIQQANYIAVSFNGSSTSIVNKDPLMLEYNLTFRLEFGCSNVMATNGHDRCFQMMMATIKELLYAIPYNTGMEIESPFMLDREGFVGITENSQFVYEQIWSLSTLVKRDQLPIDPCARRGFCIPGFSSNVLTRMPRGHVADKLGRVYTLSADGKLLTVNESGQVVDSEGNVYLEPWECLKPGGYNNNGYLVSAHVCDGQGSITTTRVVYFTGMFLLRLEMNLFRSEAGFPVEKAELDWSHVFNYEFRVYNYARTIYDTIFYDDPTNGNANQTPIVQGQIIQIDCNITLVVNDITFCKAYLMDGTTGWVIGELFYVLEPVPLTQEGTCPT